MDIFAIASFVGTVAFAFSGMIIGTEKKLDIMGVFILAMLTANGGGAIRDVLVNRTPAVLTQLDGFVITSAVFGLFVLFRLNRFSSVQQHKLFVLSDALGLTAFSVTGALIGVEAELHFFGVMVLAFITATGGGIIRDILVNEVPTLFSSDFYGSVALFVGVGIYALEHFSLANNLNLTLLFTGALALRLIAYLCKWRLPRIHSD